MKTFQINKTYEMRFIGDSELKPLYTCIKRTPKTVTLKSVKHNEVLTRKLKINRDSEYIVEGSYSMAPSIYAKHEVV